MNENDLTLTIIVFGSVAVGFFIGYMYREYILIRDVTRAMTKLKGLLRQEETRNQFPGQVNDQVTIDGEPMPQVKAMMIVELKHEVHNNMNYFYTADDDTFVCQGSTLDEAAQHYDRSQTKTVGRFTFSDGKQYIFVDSKAECVS